MSEYLDGFKGEFNKIIEHFKQELSSLRIGRAAPALVEHLPVLAYGASTPLIHLASIQAPEPRSLVIQVWDKNLVKEVQKAIIESDLGLNPNIEGNIIRLNMPPLTEETRQEVIKKLHQKMEAARIKIRNQREKVKESVVALERNKVISEDDKFKRLAELDELVKSYNLQIKELGDKKEVEIKTI